MALQLGAPVSGLTLGKPEGLILGQPEADATSNLPTPEQEAGERETEQAFSENTGVLTDIANNPRRAIDTLMNPIGALLPTMTREQIRVAQQDPNAFMRMLADTEPLSESIGRLSSSILSPLGLGTMGLTGTAAKVAGIGFTAQMASNAGTAAGAYAGTPPEQRNVGDLAAASLDEAANTIMALGGAMHATGTMPDFSAGAKVASAIDKEVRNFDTSTLPPVESEATRGAAPIVLGQPEIPPDPQITRTEITPPPPTEGTPLTPLTEAPPAEPEAHPPAQPPAATTPVSIPPSSPDDITSIKNAQVDAELKENGLPPIMSEARTSDPQLWNEAMQRIQDNPNAQNELIQRLNDNPSEVPNDVENVMLLHRKIDLENQLSAATDESAKLSQAVQDAQNVGDTDAEQTARESLADAEQKKARLADQAYDLYQMVRRTGHEQGAALRSRQLYGATDFSLATMLSERREANQGKPLTPEQVAEITTLHNKIADLQSQLDKANSEKAQSQTAAHQVLQSLLFEKPEPAKQKVSAPERFNNETAQNGPDILSWIADNEKLKSKTASKKQSSPEEWARNRSLYDGSRPLQSVHHNLIYSDTGSMPDEVAQSAHDTGVLPNASVDTLWDAIDKASKTRANLGRASVKDATTLAQDQAAHESEMRKQGITDRILTALDTQAQSARERLKGKLLSPTPQDLADVLTIGVSHIAHGLTDFAQWSGRMVSEFGETMRPYLDEVWEHATAQIEKMRQGASEALDTAQEHEDTKNKVITRVIQGKNDSVPTLGRKLSKQFVAQGVTDREELIDRVHEVLKQADPDITRSEAMDAISGYGRFKQLSKDAVDVKLRDLTGQMQQLAKLRDMEEGQAPQKTGVERRTPSDEERNLIKQVNEAKKRLGINETDSETRLKSALESSKTRISNQIKDLESQIASREKIVKTSTPPPTDAELESLKTRRDELKKQFDEIFPNQPPTSEEKAALSNRLANARMTSQLADLKDKIANGDFTTKPRPTPSKLNPENQALAAELNRARLKFKQGTLDTQLANRSLWEKSLEQVSGAVKAGALSGYHTLGKLAAFTAAKLASKPIIEGAGKAISKLPGVRGIAEASKMEGSNVSALADFYTGFAKKGMKEAAQQLRTGTTDLKSLHGSQKATMPTRWYDFFGRNLHGGEKAPLARAAFEFYLKQATEWAIRNKLDINDDLVQAALRKEAYDYSQRDILQENNKFASWVNESINRLENGRGKNDVPTATRQIAAALLKIFVTKGIVRTPSNYIMQSIESSPFGLARGIGRAALENFKGIDNLKPAEADVTMRLLKAGLVGTAMFTWGAIDATKKKEDRTFGGYFQPGQPRSPQDVRFGTVRIPGVPNSAWTHIFTHNPLTESAQMGSTFMRVALSKLRKSDVQDRGALAGALGAVMGLAQEAPISGSGIRLAGIAEPGEQNKVIGEAIKGLIPQLIQNIAEDTDSLTNTSYRPAKTIIQHIETGIPGLRENVPVKK